MRAVRYKAKAPRDKRKKAKGATMVYPAGSREMLRTHERHLELADRQKPEDKLNTYFGVKKGRTFLVDILPQLNLIDDIVIDYMHNCLLGETYLGQLIVKPTTKTLHRSGFVKASFQLTFAKKKMTRYMSLFCHGFEAIRVPTEFPRKTRAPIGNLKASEYRTIAIVGFVLFGDIFDSNREDIIKMRRLWLLQVYRDQLKSWYVVW